jgi:translocation and assembly module TamB
MARAWRISLYSLGALCALVAALVVVVLLVGNTAIGRGWIERSAARFSGGHVRLAGLSGSFPAALDLEELQLSDAQGVWLTAQRVSLRWSPLALLARHLQVQRLQIGRLDIERRPIPEAPSSKGSPAQLPRIDLTSLTIGTLELGPQLAGARVSLAVQGTAHLISLNDAAASVSAHRTDGPGEYRLAVRFDPLRMDATLRLEEPAGGPLENVLRYPGLGALSVAATLNGPRSAERFELTARAGELRGSARGTVDLNGRTAALGYDLEAPAMTPQPGLAWQRVALHGRWTGPVTDPTADARLRIEGLQLPDGAAVRSLAATLAGGRGVLTATATAEGLVLPGPQPRLLAEAPLRLACTVRLNEAERPVELTADHRLIGLQVRATTTGPTRATFDLHLKDLVPFAAIAGQHLGGRAELKGTLEPGSDAMSLQLEGGAEVGGNSGTLAELLRGASRLQLTAVLTPRTVELERLTLKGRVLSVSASGSARRGAPGSEPALQSVRARYEAKLADLTVFSPTVRGTLNLSGQLDGPLDSLAARLQLISSLAIRDAPRETIQASIRANGLPSHASATVQAEGRLAGAPLQLDAALSRDTSGAVRVAVHRAEWKSARVTGDLTTPADLTAGHGVLRLNIDRLADLQPLLGTRMAGSVSGNLTLEPRAGRTDIRGLLDAQHLSAGGFSGDLHLIASGPTDALSVRLTAQSPDVRGEPASLEADARLNLTARELALQRAQARYHSQVLHLLTPARLSFADGIALGSLRLAVQHTQIEVEGRISPALDLHAAVHRLDAALVNAFVPDTLAQGSVDADAKLQGELSSPAGLVTVKAAGLRPASSTLRDLQALDVHASARLEGSAAQLDVQLAAGPASRLKLSGEAPLKSDGALNLRLAGKIDATLVNPLLEARGQRAAGVLSVNATITGTVRSPEIGGSVDITHADVRDYVRGAHLADISAHLVGSQGTLRIESLSARATPGEVTVSGTIGVLQPKMPVSLQLKARNAQAITSDILTTSLDADLKADGTLREHIDVSGTIGLHRTVIGIPNALPPEVAVLDVRRPGQAPPPPPERKLVIGLDIKLHAPREVLVQGRGLNAELGGDLRIRGTSDNPVVNGGFELMRGSFALASSHLTFSSGRVSFNGAGLRGKIDPTLDFTAQSVTADGTTATLRITGLADSPQFELTSSPPLPQDEILARLLFGVSASQLTALQVAQIGAALASLSGIGGGGPNPLVKVQKALGLDRLSVGSGSGAGQGTQSSGTSVEAGRYVSNRVFVGAKTSTSGFSQVEVDVDLSKHLKLQSRLGNGSANTQGITPDNDPGSSIAMVYQFEY